MDKQITLEMLARRIATIRRALDDTNEPEEFLSAEIDGYRMELTTENFRIEDDGTFIFYTDK